MLVIQGLQNCFSKTFERKDERINELEAQIREKEDSLATLQNQARARTLILAELQSRVLPERDPQVSSFHKELTKKDLQLRGQLTEKD